MIHYETIYDVQKVRQRLKQDRYGSFFSEGHTRDGDRVHEFTHESAALAHSQANRDACLNLAREHKQDLVVIKHYSLQIAGRPGSGQHEQMAKQLFSDSWLKEHSKWLDMSSPVYPSLENNEHGEVMSFYSYRACLCLNEHQGVYDVASGRRMTNRREIIQRMWDLGFAANRGRPLSIAKQRWTGSREELETITRLADQYWARKHSTEAAKKMVSAYTAINRYAAWPGAW